MRFNTPPTDKVMFSLLKSLMYRPQNLLIRLSRYAAIIDRDCCVLKLSFSPLLPLYVSIRLLSRFFAPLDANSLQLLSQRRCAGLPPPFMSSVQREYEFSQPQWCNPRRDSRGDKVISRDEGLPKYQVINYSIYIGPWDQHKFV